MKNNCPNCNYGLWRENEIGRKEEGKKYCWECQSFVKPAKAGHCFRKKRKIK